MTLYLVGGPIGNLSDVSQRALEVLKEAELVICEDTRVSLKLLSKYGITGKRLISWGAGDERRGLSRVLSAVKSSSLSAYLVDAGMPGISDPGALLVRAAREEGIRIAVVPGPSALTAALSLSGFESSHFVFLGFPPRGRSKRLNKLSAALSFEVPVVLYESPHRVRELVEEMAGLGELELFVARELTKVHEETFFGTPLEALSWQGLKNPRGEYVLVVRRPPKKEKSSSL